VIKYDEKEKGYDVKVLFRGKFNFVHGEGTVRV